LPDNFVMQPSSSESLEAPHRSPLRELLALALPTVAQMASYTVMQFIDTWMLSHFGDADGRVLAPTAAMNSGILAFSVISLGMGVLWVVNTLVSQSFGAKNYAECGRYLWQGIWFAVGYSILMLPTLPYVPRLFETFGHEPRLVEMESVYLRIIVATSVFKLLATAMQQFLLAIDRANAVMWSTVIGVAANAVMAWAMIFGHAGFKPMGIVGAAWAQAFGTAVEMLVAAMFVALPTVRRTFNVADWRLRAAELRNLVRIGFPSGLQIVLDVGAWFFWGSLVMAVFGTHAMAANNFVFRYMSVSFMPAFGISVAVTALVGRYIGMRKPDVARSRANLGFYVAGAYMLACALMFVGFGKVLMRLFTDDPEIVRVGAMLLIFAAIYQCFDAMYIVYNGALRGAGDTFVPAVATGVLCWSITVLGGYAVARHWPALGPAGPWLAATAYGIILGIFMIARFQRGRWQSIRLDPPEAADRLPGFEVATQI
jgi:MATE family multidrug resistance protein